MKLRIIKKPKTKKVIKLTLVPFKFHNGATYKKSAKKETAPLQKVAKKKKRAKKERITLPPYVGWPPAGTKVTGHYTYLMPKPGEEPIVVKDRPYIAAAKTTTDKNGKKRAIKSHLRDGIKVTFRKGWAPNDGNMKANARVTLHGNLVTNIFAKDWETAYNVLKTNYGIDLKPY